MNYGATNGGQNGGQGVLPALSFVGATPGAPAGGAVIVVPFDGSLDLETGKHHMLDGARFPEKGWDPALRAQVLLAEFSQSGWWKEDLLEPMPFPTQQELATLVSYVPLRNERYAEIIAQAQDFSLYWANMLMATPNARPATWLLIQTMTAIGQLVGMRYKFRHQRARPVQVYPALMPIILTPSHPSYPNNHALQSFLIADQLTLANPALGEACGVLAERIALNREVAGVHFPSDKEASRKVADHLKSFLEKPLRALVEDVCSEWEGVRATTETPK